MPRSLHLVFALSLMLGLLLTACGGSAATPTNAPAATPQGSAGATPQGGAGATKPAASPAAAQAIQDYLAAVVNKQVDKVSALSCKDWEAQGIQELDSLQAVKAELVGVTCQQTGSDGAAALVKCSGQIVITYDTEKQNLDLNLRTYRVVQSGGDWLMCGYQP